MRTLFEISKSGLQSAERSLSVTANNVINANTPGYSRQRVEKEPVGQALRGLHAGLGVNITTITRLRNDLIDTQLGQKRQEMGYMQEKIKLFEQLETAVASDSGGDLDVHIGRLFDNFSELSNDPQDFSVRNNLVGEAIQLTEKLGDMRRSLDLVSDVTRDSVVNTTDKINEILADLANLNKSITVSDAMSRPDHASLDIQVRKLEELAELVDIETMTSKNGGLEVRIGGVQVLHQDTFRKIIPHNDDVAKTFDLRLENGTPVSPGGGRLAAAIDVYEQEVPDMKERLNLIAETLVTEFNALHRNGFGLSDDESRDFFDPGFTAAHNMRVNQEILDNHSNIAASSVPGEAGNGDVASAIANLRNQSILNGRKPVDYAVNLISAPGANLSQLRMASEARESEIRMLEVQQEREAGVNVDEELSLMIQYQNAYQGAARVMASAQQMYDTLISLVR
jgi:flagellar hook-associated protein 1